MVAEGVETGTQHQALLDAGCHLAQGYLYGKPMSDADATAWLMNNPAQNREDNIADTQRGCA